MLNFGHTFGHAIEAGTNFGISHGLAVGVGMVIAAEYAKITGVLTDKGLACTEHLAEHVKSLMGEGLSLVMESPPTINLDVVMEKFNHDKKHQSNNYRMVIPTGDGGLELVAVSNQDNERSRIKSAYIKGLHEIGYPDF